MPRVTYSHNQNGSALLLSLFFSTLFLIMFVATLNFIMIQHRSVRQSVRESQALYAGEAGVNYYRWHLAHDPDEFVADTGIRTLDDPQGGSYGQYELTVTPPAAGSSIVDIVARGYPVVDETADTRIYARYGKPSLAHFAFLSNSNVWFGEGEEISGELHSNGGVRMDGEGDSLLTSARETYICGTEHGCSNEERSGIWGTGEIEDLWVYPTEEIDFTSMLLDLTQAQTDAQSGGIYLGDSGAYGYYVEFFADSTVTIYRVNSLYPPVYGYDGTAWQYQSIDKQSWSVVSGYNRVALPANGLIFLEDDVWVGGDVRGRATVVAARLPDGSYPRADIYIQDDITYVAKDGTNALGLIAQEDVLIPLRAEDVLEIDAAVVAVNGHAYRYYYPPWSTAPYNTYAIRDRIETYGAIITNTVWTWSWVSGAGGPVVSGFEITETTYDPDIRYAPPPSFPSEDEYAFISWEELTPNE